MNNETFEVNKRRMSIKGKIIFLLCMIASTIIYGFCLSLTNDPMPYVDAFTTCASIIAMIISVKMYSEQWWIWIVVDVFSVYMWLVQFINGNDSIATLLMWVVYLLNAIVMCIKCEKEANKGKVIENEV